jgi:hypothetical protein
VSTHKALKCKVPGCNKPHHAHGYCQHCYDNLRKKKGGAVKGTGKAANQPAGAGAAQASAAEIPPRGAKQGRSAPATAVAAAAPAGPEAPKATRLVLLKARHEAMKREIDQIREDLESDEED